VRLFLRSLSGRLLDGCISRLGRRGRCLARFLPQVDPGARSEGRSDRGRARKSSANGGLGGGFRWGLTSHLSGFGVRRFLMLVARRWRGSRWSPASAVDVQLVEAGSCGAIRRIAVQRRRRRRRGCRSAAAGRAESAASGCRICRVSTLLLHRVLFDRFVTAAWSGSLESAPVRARTETAAGLLRWLRRLGGWTGTAVGLEAVEGKVITWLQVCRGLRSGLQGYWYDCHVAKAKES